MDLEDAYTIGTRLCQVRSSRGKSLRVVAGLAGMSKDTLNRIERGLRSPTLNELYALADVLQISVSELTRLPLPAPANGHTDSTIEAVGQVLDEIEDEALGGLVLPVAVLRDQVMRMQDLQRACQFAEVATELPRLISNLHTTLNTGVDHAEVLELAVHLHVHVTTYWLMHAGAHTHLLRRVAFLAQRLARERDELTTLAKAGFAVANTLLTGGQSGGARAKLGSITLPPTTAETAGLVAFIMMLHAAGAVREGRPGDAAAPMDAAAELAERFCATGGVDFRGFLFTPMLAGVSRMWFALQAGEPDQAVSLGRGVDPRRHPFPDHQATYWMDYGLALARLRGRHEDAVRALRNAERIHPQRVLRDPLIRDTLAVLLRHSRRGSAADQELRGMIRRAGLRG